MDTIKANDLINEQSPYLLQHKNNPVAWYSWSEKTLNMAQKENKPIFLSIGYSTCHWCHVMKEESFDNDDVAKVLNKNFINIKIDREEMPQIDEYYQNIYQIMNGRGGGWPLTIIMTPDKKVFFSATYMSKSKLIDISRTLIDVYKNDNKRILNVASKIDNILNSNKKIVSNQVNLEINNGIKIYKAHIIQLYDKDNGGFGGAPKFPMATMLNSMLDIYLLNNDKIILDIANNILSKMAKGGIYDQIEGGFFRYSVDEKWLIPHFEKMLYTQAELLKVYSKAYQITKNEFYKSIVDGIVINVNEKFNHNNLLFSASDADSLNNVNKKEEGYYFVFDYYEVKEFLFKKRYDKQSILDVLHHFNITKFGNFENNLNNPNIFNNSKIYNLEKIKNDLITLRQTRKYPFIDNKVQTSWSALYITGLFQASKIDIKYGKLAISLLDNLVKNMYIDNKLYHQKVNSKPLIIKALFEDYSFLIDSLIEAYQYTFEKKYIQLAKNFTTEAIEKFYKNKRWYLSDDKYKSVSSIYDSAYKNSQSTMIENLFKLATLTNDTQMYDIASDSIALYINIIKNNPISAATAFNTYIGSKQQYKVLKIPEEKREANKNIILKLDIPFLVKKTVKEKKYLACTIDSCFSFHRNLDIVIEKIKSY
jgi:uncharacterized protein YyaL (SSP411 family)